MVYLIENASQNICKIGHSKDPHGRLANLQVATPYPLHLSGTLPGSRAEEAAIHELFAAHRISGEWFHLMPEIVAHFDAVGSENEEGVNMAKGVIGRIIPYGKAGMHGMCYMAMQMRVNTQRVVIEQEAYLKHYGHKSISQFYKAINALLDAGFIAKGDTKNNYWVNPALFFRGNQTRVECAFHGFNDNRLNMRHDFKS